MPTRALRDIPAALLAALGLLLLQTPSAWSHPSIRAPIEGLTGQIRLHPGDPALYLQRGHLYRLNSDFSLAWQDFETCARLSPDEPGLDRSRAMLLMEIDAPARALELLDRAVAAAPRDAGARLLRAHALVALGRPRDAMGEFDLHLALSSAPPPDTYLKRARLVLSLDSTAHGTALAGLEQGLSRLGPAISLEEEAALLELRMGRLDAAMVRAGRLSIQFERPEAWHAWKAGLLERAGLALEAGAEYTEALDELEARMHEAPRDNRADAQLSQLRDGLRRTSRPEILSTGKRSH